MVRAVASQRLCGRNDRILYKSANVLGCAIDYMGVIGQIVILSLHKLKLHGHSYDRCGIAKDQCSERTADVEPCLP